ncbi:MAG TPA: hypothetical protein VLI39_07480 [Sedimentisphaerales bacterium]|nr:hypothetical protein [Sedimentisphaerales bacterium]
MWVFICLLCLIGAFLMLTKLSLLERKGSVLSLALATALASVGAVPWAVRVNTQELSRFLNRLDVLNDLCVLLAIESLVMLLGAARLMRRHAAHEPIGPAAAIVLAPSSACLAGIFIMIVLLCNQTTGRSYMVIGSLHGVGVWGLLTGGAFLIRRLLGLWRARLEMLLVMAFVQLVLAMFLPLVARGFTVPAQTTGSHVRALLASTALSVLCAAIALVIRAVYKAFMIRGEPQ